MAAVTSRYARAFVDVVFDSKLGAAQTTQQLRAIVALTDETAELRNIWSNPAVPPEQKRSLLDAIVARLGASRPVRNFIAVLIDHHRVNALKIIVQQFETELNTRLGVAEAAVTSSRELSEAQRKELEEQIEKLTGKRVSAQYGVDKSLLGGAIVQVGSTVYDGSVRGQLQKLKEQLSAE
jgi:F-type H+-transporting ATPase subunit delta